MPLCHWPCSCYPNHALGQVNDWMAEIYPKWVAAHGVMIVCPVNWYQAPSTLKLMIDRLVCADGGNPDPTSTGGKDPRRAKALELERTAAEVIRVEFQHLSARTDVLYLGLAFVLPEWYRILLFALGAGNEGVRRHLTVSDAEVTQP
jgi:multimeric flavodoxin WrbA